MNSPGGRGRAAVSAAAAIWAGVILAGHPVALAFLALATLLTAVGRRVVGRRVLAVGALVVAGAVAGLLHGLREEATLDAVVPEGRTRLVVTVVEEPPIPGAAALVRPLAVVDGGRRRAWRGPTLAADGLGDAATGSVVEVAGRLRARPGRVRGDAVAGRLQVDTVELLSPPTGLLPVAGELVRRRVDAVLGGTPAPSVGLLAGFLVGDLASLPVADAVAMRRAGLSHLTAVSGSNVALFLAGWWILTYPLAVRPRWRAVVGVVGLAVFAAATRFEPSVLRASVAAGVVLVGAAVGLVVDGWTALGSAVALLLLVAPQLAGSAGFQLSVAATAGLLLARPSAGGVVARTLRATIAAQVAVLPLLLVWFGSVPVVAPAANVLAVPLAAMATAVGGVAVATGWTPLVRLASVPAAAVLGVARAAASWPQLDAAGVAIAAIGVALLVRVSRRRRAMTVGLAVVVAVAWLAPPGPPKTPTVTFVDVGQGDLVLLRDPSGAVIVVDGGPDPVRFAEALLRRGLRRIDLLVVTHGDLDHVAGLDEVFDSFDVRRVWTTPHPDLGPELEELLADAGAKGVTVERPPPGRAVRLGELRVEVIGPRRRYLARNDGSLVLLVTAGGREVLLPGDVEAIGQGELPPLRPDVLLVPHHASTTSDLSWLAATVGPGVVAVVSVGPNRYGHPRPEVLATLRAAGAEVRLTWVEGDVVVPLGDARDRRYPRSHGAGHRPRTP